MAECPYEFYRKWVLDAEEARESAKRITRKTIGTRECPIEGLPAERALA